MDQILHWNFSSHSDLHILWCMIALLTHVLLLLRGHRVWLHVTSPIKVYAPWLRYLQCSVSDPISLDSSILTRLELWCWDWESISQSRPTIALCSTSLSCHQRSSCWIWSDPISTTALSDHDGIASSHHLSHLFFFNNWIHVIEQHIMTVLRLILDQLV